MSGTLLDPVPQQSAGRPVQTHALVRDGAELLASFTEHCRREPRRTRQQPPQSMWIPEHDGWTTRSMSWAHVQSAIARRPKPNGGDLLAVVVPGTNESGDWWRGNLRMGRRTIPGAEGKWRAGFAEAGDHVWRTVWPTLGTDDSVLLVGHSFGAAAVTCAAAYAARVGLQHTIAGVLAFAGPRCTNRRGAAWLEEQYRRGVGQRFLLGFDLVPHAVLPIGWRHAFDPLFIDPVTLETVPEPPPFFAALKLAVKRPGFQPTADHDFEGYLRWARSL